MTSSINYLHREKFRSDILITFHAPIVLTPQHDANLFSPDKEERMDAINKLTELLESTVRSNLLDAQDWDTVRLGHVARKIYAGHLGTRISLGQYVRLTRKFVAAFSRHQQVTTTNGKSEDGNGSGDSDSSSEKTVNEIDQEATLKIDALAKDLAVSSGIFRVHIDTEGQETTVKTFQLSTFIHSITKISWISIISRIIASSRANHQLKCFSASYSNDSFWPASCPPSAFQD